MNPRQPNPDRFTQLVSQGMEATVNNRPMIKRDILNKKGQLLRTEYIGYATKGKGVKKKPAANVAALDQNAKSDADPNTK